MWFLVFVLVASGVGIAVVLMRNRKPVSMEASIEEFGRSLKALAPDESPGPGVIADDEVAGPG